MASGRSGDPAARRPPAKIDLRLHLASGLNAGRRAGAYPSPFPMDRHDARDRIACAILGCSPEDLDLLAELWERYDLDDDPDDIFGRDGAFRDGAFRAVMGRTLASAAAFFLDEHGLSPDEPRHEINNFRNSRMVFRDPAVQRLFEAWRPG